MVKTALGSGCMVR